MKETLKNVIATLKTIDVRGFNSMDALVGCVITLQNVINELDNKESKEENTDG